MDGLVLRALRNIQPGREITAHYGEDWSEAEGEWMGEKPPVGD